MSRHLRRCPATRLRIEDGRLQGSDRCEYAAAHAGPHVIGGFRWTFTAGSYSGIAKDDPRYDERLSHQIGGDNKKEA